MSTRLTGDEVAELAIGSYKLLAPKSLAARVKMP
jgi:hypothetical protein